jgi:hypothetical protein
MIGWYIKDDELESVWRDQSWGIWGTIPAFVPRGTEEKSTQPTKCLSPKNYLAVFEIHLACMFRREREN